MQKIVSLLVILGCTLALPTLAAVNFQPKDTLRYAVINESGAKVGSYSIKFDNWPLAVTAYCSDGAEDFDFPFCPQYRPGQDPADVAKTVNFGEGTTVLTDIRVSDGQGGVRSTVLTHGDTYANRLTIDRETLSANAVQQRVRAESKLYPYSLEGILLGMQRDGKLIADRDLVWVEEQRAKHMVIEKGGKEQVDVEGFPSVRATRYDYYEIDTRNPKRRGLMYSLYLNGDGFPIMLRTKSKSWGLAVEGLGEESYVTTSLQDVERAASSRSLGLWLADVAASGGGADDVDFTLVESRNVLDVNRGSVTQNEIYEIPSSYPLSVAVDRFLTLSLGSGSSPGRDSDRLTRHIARNADGTYALKVPLKDVCANYRQGRDWEFDERDLEVEASLDERCKTFDLQLEAKDFLGKKSDYYLSSNQFPPGQVPAETLCGDVSRKLVLVRGSNSRTTRIDCRYLLSMIENQVKSERDFSALAALLKSVRPEELKLALEEQEVSRGFGKGKVSAIGASISYSVKGMVLDDGQFAGAGLCEWLLDVAEGGRGCRLDGQSVVAKQGLVLWTLPAREVDYAVNQSLRRRGLKVMEGQNNRAVASSVVTLDDARRRDLIEALNGDLKGCEFRGYAGSKRQLKYWCSMPRIEGDAFWRG
jgi:hypothetical protein